MRMFAAIVFGTFTVFIALPLLALLPAAGFAALYGASGRRLVAAAAVLLKVAPRNVRGRIGGMLAVILFSAFQVAAQQAPGDGLAAFKAWLERVHPGYACDRGPAQFRNKAVEAAYPGRRFYYVLSYTRGMRPRLPNELSVVARVDENGTVTPLSPSSPATYRPGLRKVATAGDARRSGAAVLILAMGDPGDGLPTFQDSLFTVKKGKEGWVCSYGRGGAPPLAQVTFDKSGLPSTIRLDFLPVP
jgi:hypothetical protein